VLNVCSRCICDTQVYTQESGKKEFRHFLDNQQYQTNGILRYERIFGQGYVSTGGFETTKVCTSFICSVIHSFVQLCHQKRLLL